LKCPDWLLFEQLVDEGSEAGALYPYSLLKNILSREDCREAILDETISLEQEFGRDQVEPLYQLLWTLNTIEDICTSHTNTSPLDRKSPFEWARHFVGAAIIILPRKLEARRGLREAEGMAGALCYKLGTNQSVPSDTTGWQIRVFPTTVYHQTYGGDRWRGYAHRIVISGSAGTRRHAAERWARAVTFVTATLATVQGRSTFRHI
jgi:hypothetical protein